MARNGVHSLAGTTGEPGRLQLAASDSPCCAFCVAASATPRSDADVTPADDRAQRQEVQREPTAAKVGGIWKQTLVDEVAASVRALLFRVRCILPNCLPQTPPAGAASSAFAERKAQEERCVAGCKLRHRFCSAAEALSQGGATRSRLPCCALQARAGAPRSRPKVRTHGTPSVSDVTAHTHKPRYACVRSNTVRVLFASEWNVCRSVLAGTDCFTASSCLTRKH